MTEETLEKAKQLELQMHHWREQIDELRKVISSPAYYHIGFTSEHNQGYIKTEMNNMLMVPFAKQCLEFAENRLRDAQNELAKL